MPLNDDNCDDNPSVADRSVGKGDGAVGQRPLHDDTCDDNPSVDDLYLLAKVTMPLTNAFKRRHL